MHETAKVRPYTASAIQLGLSMAAVVTASELLKQCLVQICTYPALIAPLREEVEQAVAQHGWTGAALAHMQHLDSVIKETQRLYPLSEGAFCVYFQIADIQPVRTVNLERKVIRDTALPNGQTLPGGTKISIHTGAFLDASVYPDPSAFDSARFPKLRQAGGRLDSAASVVLTSTERFVFGLGKYNCSVKFMAIAEVKTALAVVLREYDVRFQKEYAPRTVKY
jgi:cytochrome P450